ncbi:hypothetical protein GCM10009727_13150 [Actinomadura napierensis]|uniref:DUF397 domain-containing protein n=1 Tax=Actinomadura napierensis TaxID=267854 RepID=A0ABN2YBX6_9ACTN
MPKVPKATGSRASGAANLPGIAGRQSPFFKGADKALFMIGVLEAKIAGHSTPLPEAHLSGLVFMDGQFADA